jgi:small subunit ribosomal protein S13
MLFIFDTKISEKKRVDLVLRECYGIGKTHSFRIFAKLGFNIRTKMKDLPSRLFKQIDSRITYVVNRLFRLKVETFSRHLLHLQLKVIRNNKSYRSLRHFFKLPVRGQRTRNNAQTQKRKRPNWRRVPIAGKKK